jgi:hypothetical protein
MDNCEHCWCPNEVLTTTRNAGPLPPNHSIVASPDQRILNREFYGQHFTQAVVTNGNLQVITGNLIDLGALWCLLAPELDQLRMPTRELGRLRPWLTFRHHIHAETAEPIALADAVFLLLCCDCRSRLWQRDPPAIRLRA